MAFTTTELNNIANSALDFYFDKGKVRSNTIQTKPFLAALDKKAKTFPGGKGNVSVAVKGAYTTQLQGYTHDQQVSYQNPANIKRANFPWREHHAGIALTLTELKIDGISVVDSMDSATVRNHDDREMTALVNLLDDKLEDMQEGYDRSLNAFVWGDGTIDPLALAGIRSLVIDTPGSGTTGGLDRGANPWWNNRSNVASPVTVNAATGALVQFLQNEHRQLTRYGGKPTIWLAGSAFINGLETELRANGRYTVDGFQKDSNATEFGMGQVKFHGQDILYDPTLDDLGFSKRMYALDLDNIFLDYMTGEKMKRHTPARPPDRYVMFRAITTTGCLVARQLNSSGVYLIN